MQYALLYFEAPAEAAKRTDPDASPAYWAAWSHYMETLGSAIQAGRALQRPDTATFVRGSETGRVVEDGPFADTREELGGFVIVDAESLDDAITMAERAPCAQPAAGHVEVRPVLVPSSERQ